MSYLQQLLILLPIIFISGFVDSIAGGGGIISLPAYQVVGLNPTMVLGTNKLSASIGSLTSTARFIKNKSFSKKIFPSIAFALIGSAIGAEIAVNVDDLILKYILIGALPVLAVFMLFKKDFKDDERYQQYSKLKLFVMCALVAFVIGMYDGFFGPGTGTFLILLYTSVVGFSLRESLGNAKIINFSTNIAAVVVFMYNGQIDYRLALPAAGAAILGNYIGTGLAIKNGKKIVRPMLVVVLTLLLGSIIYGLIMG